MQANYILLGILAISVLACRSRGKRTQTNNASITAAQKAELEQLIQEQLEKRDENGNVSELEGFNTSEGITALEPSNTTLAELKAGTGDTRNDPIQPEKPVFDFDPPEGIEAEFSEPVMVIGSSLSLAKGRNSKEIEAVCAGLEYYPKEPTMKDILEYSRQNNICGEATFNFCIRLTKPGFLAYTYAQSPNLNLDLPCPENTFSGAKIEIDYGRPKTEATTTIIDILAKNSVTELYLTNTPGCTEGGGWQKIIREDPLWTLNWVDDVATVYAKFKDIFGQESECIFDTVTFGTGGDMCFAYESGFTADNILSGVTIADIEGTAGDYPICSSDGQTDCVTSSDFKGLEKNQLTAEVVLTGNTIGGIAGTAVVQTYSNCTGANQKDCITTATFKSMDLSEAGATNGLLASNFVTRLLAASDFEFWDASGNKHTVSGDTDITASNIVASKEIFGVTGSAGGTPDCSNISVGGSWILVPGDSDYGTNDFCVMKYEAKCTEALGTNCAIATHSPISQVDNTPWVSIDQQDARTACGSLGKGFHLITNDEWMTIGANAAALGSNWDGGNVGTNGLARGHSDDSPNEACAADANDANSYVEGSCTGSSTGTFVQRRTHTLSNGAVIWDLAGNVREWTSYFNDEEKPTPLDVIWDEFTDLSGTTTMPLTDLIPQTAIDSSWNSTKSIGGYYSGNDSSGGAMVRGGHKSDDPNAGVFSIRLDADPTTVNTLWGFRCVVAVP